MLYAGQTHTVSVPLTFKNTNLKEQKIKDPSMSIFIKFWTVVRKYTY